MIHVFVGTKAQLIKMAPVMRLMQDRGIEYNFIFSGQHKDTIDDILGNFSITRKPDVTLYAGDDITGIAQMGRWMLQIASRYGKSSRKMELFRGGPNGIVLNHGDTFSTLLGSWQASRHNLKSGHVESGLRSHNLLHPFPEEITRLLTFRYSDYFFVPGETAMGNLARYKGVKVNTLNNTLYDALRLSGEASPVVEEGRYSIISLHRFENIFSKPKLGRIVRILLESDDSIRKLFILHKPTLKKLREYGLYDALEYCSHIELRPRYDYFRFIGLVKGAEYVITDGGSNQEECFYLGKPCLLMRKATERDEGVGENVVISGYDERVVGDFVRNYQGYIRPPLQLDHSPSGIILDNLRQFVD